LKYNGIKESGFEMWCWRRMEKIERVRKDELLNGVKKEGNIVHTMKRT
jgi:hypothetical protein